MEEEIIQVEIKRPKTFKEYYADPEYKKKHKAYCLENIECECGRLVSRVGMYRHKSSQIHLKTMQKKEQNTNIINDIVDRIVTEKLKKIIIKTE